MVYVVFGYGSLIWKPPPHAATKTVGYVKGFVRRFAQSSNDHRGTPERLGRVVTLVPSQAWETLTGEQVGESESKVWGAGWTIDPKKEDEVRADLNHREKNGYSVQTVDLWNHDDEGNEHVVVHGATLYIGTTDNEAFVGSEPLATLSQRIHSTAGPSGLNKDYLYELATAVRELDPQAEEGDKYLFELEAAVRALDDEAQGPADGGKKEETLERETGQVEVVA